MAGFKSTNEFTANYQLKEELGRGAFGVVKRCIHVKSGEQYAAKIIDTSTLTNDDFLYLETETLICRKLKHPNIVLLKDNILERSYYYLIFELVTGGELLEDIVARTCYSEEDASFCMEQILQAVVYCHNNNIIHRDIKPENLLLSVKTNRAPIKMTDFGLSIVLKDKKKKHWYGFAGTPEYMAPEIIRKVPYGKPVDVFSCGIILYILLSGIVPFWGEDRDELMTRIVKGEYDYRSPEWDGISSDAKKLVDRMMANIDDERITSLEALRHPWISRREKVASKLHRQGTLDSIKKLNARAKIRDVVEKAIGTSRRSRAKKYRHQ